MMVPKTAIALPRAEWRYKREGDLLLVAMHENGGGYYWTKFAPSDLPNEHVTADDLERILSEGVEAAPICESPLPFPREMLSRPFHRTE
jgi:hypothetical protein